MQRSGVVVFITGLPESGKSTTASMLCRTLVKSHSDPVTLLDGDSIRKTVSADLGFSNQDRDTHIRRLGRLAAEISSKGEVCICAAIAPYDAARREVRRMVELSNSFVLVYLNTRLEVCERRDSKGLYAKARAGIVQQFTGISDPYEAPSDAEVTIDTETIQPAEAAEAIVQHLKRYGLIGT